MHRCTVRSRQRWITASWAEASAAFRRRPLGLLPSRFACCRVSAPDDIPITHVNAFVPQVDWRQLRRWSLAESRLPEGTIVLFRSQGAWERYRPYILATMVIVVAQTCLIAGLLVQRRRRRRAEQTVVGKEAALRTSYERISDLAGRLITAQEAERTRIARELHDDACQEVAGVAVDISNLLQRAGDLHDANVRHTLSSVRTRVADVA